MRINEQRELWWVNYNMLYTLYSISISVSI